VYEADVRRASWPRTRGSVAGPAVPFVEPDGTRVPLPDIHLAHSVSLTCRHLVAAGTVVHSPRPGMQLRERIAVARRCVSNADHLSWLCHEVRGYDSTLFVAAGHGAVELFAEDAQVAQMDLALVGGVGGETRSSALHT
jgi:hypothetical protein